jgi:hypothetical protein
LLVEALCCKPERRSFCSQLPWFLSTYVILPAALSLGVDAACGRNEYQESSLGVKRGRRLVWKLHCHMWADCLENTGSSTSHKPIGLHGLLQG